VDTKLHTRSSQGCNSIAEGLDRRGDLFEEIRTVSFLETWPTYFWRIVPTHGWITTASDRAQNFEHAALLNESWNELNVRISHITQLLNLSPATLLPPYFSEKYFANFWSIICDSNTLAEAPFAFKTVVTLRFQSRENDLYGTSVRWWVLLAWVTFTSENTSLFPHYQFTFDTYLLYF